MLVWGQKKKAAYENYIKSEVQVKGGLQQKESLGLSSRGWGRE